MRLIPGRRRGVASIIGTLLFVIVLLAGFVALEYMDAVQGQSAQAEQAALGLMATRASASLTFHYLNGLTVTNTGPTGLTVVDLFLKFANGSIYAIGADAPVASGGNQALSPLISGTCGGSSCASKYNTLLSSSNQGDAIGVLTAAGASFWYSPASQASIPNSCNSLGTLSMQVSPSGAGSTSPGAVAQYCEGQVVETTALPAPGYSFSSWTGTGNGSYTGNANPASVTVNKMITETANFVVASGPGEPAQLGQSLAYTTTASQMWVFPSIVQSGSVASTSLTSISLAYSSPIAAGNMLVAICEVYSSGALPADPTISDGVNAWTKATSIGSGTTSDVVIYYAAAAVGGARPTVTCSYSGTTSAASNLEIYELAGVSASTLATSTGSGTGSAATVASFNSALPNIVLAGGVISSCCTSWTAGSGYTLTGSGQGTSHGSGETAQSISPVTAGFSFGVSEPWKDAAVAFSISPSGFLPLSPLSFTGNPNTLYQVTLFLGYYQAISQSPGPEFAVSGPSGATVLACGGMATSDLVNGGGSGGALTGPVCVSSFDTVIGLTTSGNDYCNSPSSYYSPCLYEATIYVTFGSTGGTFNAEWKCIGSSAGTVLADSAMIVTGG
jgi:Divergent InlB B-repeat domain